MKKLIFFIIVFFISATSIYSQCEISSFIQDNYELDAKVLVMREILNNPLDPDYDNPFLPVERTTPFLEKLSAIYENPTNNASIDSLFNEFQIHVNWEYSSVVVPFKKMVLAINNNAPWVENFIDTGVSGIPELDNLMTDYQFSIYNSFELPSAGWFVISIETNYNFLNITALLDDFLAIEEIVITEPEVPIEDRFNYTGIPYWILNEPVEVCDIFINDDIYTFGLFAGDCPAGCFYGKLWNLQVNEGCEVTLLSTPNNSLASFSIYPNPTSDLLFITGLSNKTSFVTIYNIQGQIIKTSPLQNKRVDVSALISGMYFLMIQTNDGEKAIQKFIKK